MSELAIYDWKRKATTQILENENRTKEKEAYEKVLDDLDKIIKKIQKNKSIKSELIQQIYKEINLEWIVNPYNQDVQFPDKLIGVLASILYILFVKEYRYCQLRCLRFYLPTVIRILQKQFNDNFIIIDCYPNDVYIQEANSFPEDCDFKVLFLNEFPENQIPDPKNFYFLVNPVISEEDILLPYFKRLKNIVNNSNNFFIYSYMNFDYSKLLDRADKKIERINNRFGCVNPEFYENLPPGDIHVSDMFTKTSDRKTETKHQYTFRNLQPNQVIQLKQYSSFDINDFILLKTRMLPPDAKEIYFDLSQIYDDVEIRPLPSDMNIRRFFIAKDIKRFDYMRPVLREYYKITTGTILNRNYVLVFLKNSLTKDPMQSKTRSIYGIQPDSRKFDDAQEVSYYCEDPQKSKIYGNLTYLESEIIDDLIQALPNTDDINPTFICSYIFFSFMRKNFFRENNYNSPLYLEIKDDIASSVVPAIKRIIKALIWKPIEKIDGDIEEIRDSFFNFLKKQSVEFDDFNSVIFDVISKIDENCWKYQEEYKLDLFKLVDNILKNIKKLPKEEYEKFDTHFIEPDQKRNFSCPGMINVRFKPDEKVFMLNVHKFGDQYNYSHIHGKIMKSIKNDFAQCAIFCELIHLLDSNIIACDGTIFYSCDDERLKDITEKLISLMPFGQKEDKWRFMLCKNVEKNPVEKGILYYIGYTDYHDTETYYTELFFTSDNVANFYLYDFNLENLELLKNNYEYIALCYWPNAADNHDNDFCIKFVCNEDHSMLLKSNQNRQQYNAPNQNRQQYNAQRHNAHDKTKEKVYVGDYPVVVQEAYKYYIRQEFNNLPYFRKEDGAWTIPVDIKDKFLNFFKDDTKRLKYINISNLIDVDPSILLYHANMGTELKENFLVNKINNEIFLPHIRILFNKKEKEMKANKKYIYKYKFMFPELECFGYIDQTSFEDFREKYKFEELQTRITLNECIEKINIVDFMLNLYNSIQTKGSLMDLIRYNYDNFV